MFYCTVLYSARLYRCSSVLCLKSNRVDLVEVRDDFFRLEHLDPRVGIDQVGDLEATSLGHELVPVGGPPGTAHHDVWKTEGPHGFPDRPDKGRRLIPPELKGDHVLVVGPGVGLSSFSRHAHQQSAKRARHHREGLDDDRPEGLAVVGGGVAGTVVLQQILNLVVRFEETSVCVGIVQIRNLVREFAKATN